MKKIMLFGLLSISLAACVDDGWHQEGYSYENRNAGYQQANYAAPVNYGYATQGGCGYAAQTQSAPCGRTYGAPVSVKTATEVVDHYQTYQPVTTYEAAGSYSTREVQQVASPCRTCGY